VPGSSPRKIAKAQTLPVDEVVLDLEDALIPAEKNDATRSGVAAALRGPWLAAIAAVRVNSSGSPWFLDDVTQVATLAGPALSSIVLPKVESAGEIHLLDELLTKLESPGQRIAIEAQIESARGLMNVEEIAASSDRLQALVFGPADFAASLAVPQFDVGAIDPTYPGDQWAYPRSRIAVAAHAHGLDPIDGPYGAYRDLPGLKESARRALFLGFAGKWVIHPAQIGACNEVFSSSPEEIARAHAIIEALGDAARSGDGATSLDGSMLDEASRRLAAAILARAPR
jgi:citrate lyase subunit beta/citryl-CoA lyase